jgi:DNA invertase Pin-like site-specific DNA recombinase
MVRRVALYARVSTRDKDQNPEVQLVPLRGYVAARGWEAVEYVDHAPAGDLAHRTAWRQLLKDAARRRFDLLLVWKLDRAFRSTLDALSTLRELEHRAVGFSSLTQPELDTTSPTGRLVFTILSAVAEMERSLIADRVKEGMKLAASRGVKMGRPSVTDGAAFQRKWPGIRAQVLAGTLSQRKAAKQLDIGATTLKRLLDGDTEVLQQGVAS